MKGVRRGSLGLSGAGWETGPTYYFFGYSCYLFHIRGINPQAIGETACPGFHSICWKAAEYAGRLPSEACFPIHGMGMKG